MPDFLQQMAESSARRAAEALQATSLCDMRGNAEHMPPARPLKVPEFALIAEIKRAAPSSGALTGKLDIAERAKQYEEAGAAAVSVLTEPQKFLGSLQDLRDAKAATALPVMRKDFLVQPYQVFEARANGADGVLLIAALLSDPLLREMLEIARYLGMFALVEAFDEVDIERAQDAGAGLVGVNCRNLRSLAIDFERFERLRRLIDVGRIAVAESGITSAEGLQRVRELGYHAALVGSALMREDDPVAAIGRLRGTS
jgi:indole-3-glycerol phosphate synthase